MFAAGKLRLVRSISISVVVALIAAQTASSATYVVNPSGTGDFPTIQTALDAAEDGDVIFLDDGVFTGDGNRDIQYWGKSVAVSSLSGDPTTCVIDCGGSAADPHRGFYFQSGEGGGSVLDGVTVTKGYALSGGALWFIAASPTVRNCILRGNAAQFHGGGAICGNGASPSFVECRFLENHAQDRGGGLYCFQGSCPSLADCVLSGNSAFRGGGLYCYYSGPSLAGTSVSDNTSDENGGGVYCYTSAPLLVGCSFVENEAHEEGGGVYCIEQSSPTVSNCLFSGNSCTYDGAALYCHGYSSPSVTDSRFRANSAGWSGGAAHCSERSAPVFTRCLFMHNLAQTRDGGVLECDTYSSPALANCTLFENTAGRHGAGVFAGLFCSPSLDNTIVSFSLGGEAICCGWMGTVILTCCDVYGNAGGDWEGCIEGQSGQAGNLCDDPQFCGPDTLDLTIAEGSPCAPVANPACGLIGACPVGCESSVAFRATWGAIKAMFR